MNFVIAIRDRMSTVELRHLEYFVAVAAELNFSSPVINALIDTLVRHVD
jgi:hypothetical protein